VNLKIDDLMKRHQVSAAQRNQDERKSTEPLVSLALLVNSLFLVALVSGAREYPHSFIHCLIVLILQHTL